MDANRRVHEPLDLAPSHPTLASLTHKLFSAFWTERALGNGKRLAHWHVGLARCAGYLTHDSSAGYNNLNRRDGGYPRMSEVTSTACKLSSRHHPTADENMRSRN